MFRKLKQLYALFNDDYQNHLLKCEVSFYKNYLKLKFVSIFRKRIVAISLIEHIGDIIANEPVSREVRKQHPGAIIIWFVRKPYIDLVKFNHNIDKVFTVYCLTSWIKIKEAIRFHAVYDLHFNGRACNKCHVSLKKDVADDSITGTNYLNYGGLLQAVCLNNGIRLSDDAPKMYIPKMYIDKSSHYCPPGKYVVVHCASNEEIKDWDNKKWEELALNIIEIYGLSIVEVGSTNNISIKSDYYHNLCGKLSTLESAFIISKAELFIGIDSGPAHMANALNIPGIILLGEYYFGMKNYNPYSGNYGSLKDCHLVQSNDKVKNIPVEIVFENIRTLLIKQHTN